MAEQIIPYGFNPSHEPLHHSVMPPSWHGGKVTNTEAQALVSKLRRRQDRGGGIGNAAIYGQ